MFRTTFLGHQGWLLGAGDTQILVDPLLEAGAGELDEYWVKIYPPRRFDYQALGPVHAVVLSHEHPDHFHVPSLMRLDRSIPIVLSSLSSRAAREFLTAQGFEVLALAEGSRTTLGALELIGLRPDGRTAAHELDVVPFVVRDHEGHGNFFSCVDLSLTPAMTREALSWIPRPGVWTLPNNDLDMSAFCGWLEPDADQSPARANDWASGLRACFGSDLCPELVLLYGGGFAFDGALEPLNARLFNCDMASAARHLAVRLSQWICHPASPGETVVLRDGRLESVEPPRGFVTPAPRDAWPVHRASADAIALPPPSSGRERLRPDERRELPELLSRFANFLRESSLTAGVTQLYKRGSERPLLALWLHEAGSDFVYTYDADRSEFVVREGVEDPRARYTAGVECWATDFVELLRLERPPGYVVLGHMRFWNARARELELAFDMLFYLYCHPLHHPEHYLRLYTAQSSKPIPKDERIAAG